MKRYFVLLATITIYVVFSWNPVFAFSTPVAVSPGSSENIVSVNECCPTFSWSAVELAEGYELTVFVLDGSEESVKGALLEDFMQVSEPEFTISIPAPALSWTPSQDQSFTPGKTYAWFIRSQNGSDSGYWSAPAFFQVPENTISNLDQAVNDALATFFSDSKSDLTLWSNIDDETDTDLLAQDNFINFPESDSQESFLRGTNIDDDDNNNTIFGGNAGKIIVDGGYVDEYASRNVFIGFNTGYSTSNDNELSGAADNNTFVGAYSGYRNSTGNRNAFLGDSSGGQNETGAGNTFLGYAAGYGNATGHSNVLVGYRTAYSKTTLGNGNIMIGYEAGYSPSVSSEKNIFIGYQAGYYETGSNKLYIDNSDTSSPLIYGDFSADQLKVNGTLEFTSAYATSDRRWKKEIKSLSEPLAAILHLNGVSYLWNREEFPEKGFCENPQIGLIAQEVEKILPEIVKTDGEGYKSVAYTQIIPVLIEAVKSQQEIIEKQRESFQEQIDTLKSQLDSLLGEKI